VSYDEEKFLKVDTYVGGAHTGVSILGVFNVSQNPLTEIVKLDDFPGTEDGEYIIWSHVARKLSKPTTRKDKTALVCMELGIKGYDILSAYPLKKSEIGSGKVAVAPLGLLGKMTGAAAIVNADASVDENGRLRVWINLKAFGRFGMNVQFSLLFIPL
jgi:hypothetical protein